MINELYHLSKAMEQAGIASESWHRKYKPIPNVNDKAPCIRICLSESQITRISTVSKELGACLRKYGSPQGTFPCCNLAPLYRVTDEEAKKKILELQAGKLENYDLDEVRSWCISGNWGRKFRKKYAISLKGVPDELRALLNGKMNYAPIRTLVDEAAFLAEPEALFSALQKTTFEMLERKVDVALAMQILFHAGNAQKDAEDDKGALSVIFDSERLIAQGIPSASDRFTREFNFALLEADTEGETEEDDTIQDAFGLPFTPLEEPMPTVKLAGGFEVTLRTMFSANRCQSRYGVADDASYPLSPSMRLQLQSSLLWMGNAAHRYQTWINTDKDEILFVYPHTLPQTNIQFIRAFKRVPNSVSVFENEAKQFIADLRIPHPRGPRADADRLQIFILRKIDKARTKVLYTRVTDPDELENRSAAWSQGCTNLPRFPFGQPNTPFPMDVADVLNRVWKQNGTPATDKFKPIPHYRGMELLMEADASVTQDLSMLAKSCVTLAPFLGELNVTDRSHSHQIWWKAKEMLALCGLLLNRLKVRKENYMEDFPYQYGQLLKVSDELHVLYCKVVRKGEVAPQLAGSGLVQAATEAPIRTLSQLGQRMMPYVSWARSYRHYNLTEKEKAKETSENPNAMLSTARASWLLNLYEMIVDKLYRVWDTSSRFDDAQRAQLFLGYLAALPKKDKTSAKHNNKKSEATDEMEENNHE